MSGVVRTRRNLTHVHVDALGENVIEVLKEGDNMTSSIG
jgi:hypothetical protein